MDESEKTSDLQQVKGFSLIDEDDSLIFNSPSGDLRGHHSPENQEQTSIELSEALDASNMEDTMETFKRTDQVPQLLESPEPERPIKNGKYNLRKSLAWDTAFFTNAGVLDPEELSCMIGGVEKGGKKLLPGIQEDVHRSTDSISSLESDNLTLEGLEADLFENIRASIQKSSKFSNVSISSTNLGSGVADTQTHSSKIDLASQNKMMPKPTSKKPGPNKIVSGKTTKQPSVCSEVPKRASTNGLVTPSVSKPPKVLGRGSPMSSISTRRASLSSDRMKKEMDNAKGSTGRGNTVSKISSISGSRSNVPRPIPSSKPSTMSSTIATKIDPRTSCSSFGSSCSSDSASSDNASKFSLNSMKRKVDSKTANKPSSNLNPKTLSRSSNKIQYGNSQLSAYLKSVSNLSSSISPASSISEWSSGSSASTSTVNQRSSVARASLDISKGVPIDSDASKVVSSGSHSNDLCSGRNGTQVTGMLGRGVKKASAGVSSHPVSAKPSGLRLPSPKIGFFDGAKSLVRTPNGSSQSSPSGALHRDEAGRIGPSGNSNKVKLGKFQPARTVTVVGNTKPDTQRIALGTKLKSPIPQEPSNASLKTSNASRNASSSLAMSSEVRNKMSPKTNGENHLKLEDLEAKELDTAMHNPEFSLVVEDGTKVKSSVPQDPSNASRNASSSPSMTLKTNGENHLKPEELEAKEPDISMHNGKFSLTAENNNSGLDVLKEEASVDTRVPLAVRDSFWNRDGS